MNSINKKSPAKAKGNAQQWCMIESPVKINLSSPIKYKIKYGNMVMMFLL